MISVSTRNRLGKTVVSPTEPAKEKSETIQAARPPEYTMQDIHNAIPRHCYEADTLRSLGLVMRDCAMVLTLLGFATWIPYIDNAPMRVLAWSTYGFCQGLVFTGLWELAHESGHGALSRQKWVNNAIGLLIHSTLLVPYHSWQFTHRTHHKATNHLDRDIAFMPHVKAPTEANGGENLGLLEKAHDIVADCPLAAFITLLVHQLIAFPIYLTLNNFALSRIREVPWWKRSHFYFGGDGPNFKPEHAKAILISDFAMAGMLFVLWVFVRLYGSWCIFLFYGLPYLWTNHWILTITFLQHTDVMVPYYSSQSWSFLRGAASTIDRDFGLIGRYLFHGTIETHVLHHHISHIPCYHAAEATAAIRKVMGSNYHRDTQTPYLVAFWKNYRQCCFVEERGSGSYYYKSS